MVKITFASQNMTISVSSGSELLQVKQRHPDIPLKFGCTRGDCGVCAVKVWQGRENLTKCSKQELVTLQKKGLGDDYRLACQCAINGDVVLE